jgi:ribosomal protein S18 acetylase RimI-like enzyme
MNLSIRRLSVGDVKIAQEAVRKFDRRDISSAHLLKLLSNNINYLIVAQSQTELVGVLYAHRLERLNQKRSHLFIYSVEVAPEHWRQGVATALIRFIRKIADEAQMEAFVFTNHSNTAAIRLYQSTGAIVKGN